MNKYMLIKFRFKIPSDCWELQNLGGYLFCHTL